MDKNATQPVKIYSAKNRIEADMLVQALRGQDIPAYHQGVGGSGYMDLIMGNAAFGEDIYVNERDREAATEIIEAIVTPVDAQEENPHE